LTDAIRYIVHDAAITYFL